MCDNETHNVLVCSHEIRCPKIVHDGRELLDVVAELGNVVVDPERKRRRVHGNGGDKLLPG